MEPSWRHRQVAIETEALGLGGAVADRESFLGSNILAVFEREDNGTPLLQRQRLMQKDGSLAWCIPAGVLQVCSKAQTSSGPHRMVLHQGQHQGTY